MTAELYFNKVHSHETLLQTEFNHIQYFSWHAFDIEKSMIVSDLPS